MLTHYYRRLLAQAVREMGLPGAYKPGAWGQYLSLGRDIDDTLNGKARDLRNATRRLEHSV